MDSGQRVSNTNDGCSNNEDLLYHTLDILSKKFLKKKNFTINELLTLYLKSPSER